LLVEMNRHKDSVRLRAQLKKLLPRAIRWAGVTYRSVSTEYATSSDILTGIGSQMSGGRWNPLGSFPTVYLSLEPETSFAETLSHVRYYGLQPQDALPRTFVAVDVKLHRVLDLTNQENLKTLMVTRRSLLAVDWRTYQDAGEEAITQAIGRIARELGFEGLLVPSATTAKGTNLVLYPGSLSAKSEVTLLNADRLKPIR
jgi:RES domain-containing protein